MSEDMSKTLKSVLKIGGLVLATSLIGIILLFYANSVTEYQEKTDVEKLCGLVERSSINLELRLVENTETNELIVVDCNDASD